MIDRHKYLFELEQIAFENTSLHFFADNEKKGLHIHYSNILYHFELYKVSLNYDTLL